MDLAVRTGQRIGAILRLRRDQLLEESIRFGRHKTDLKGIVSWTPGHLQGALRSMAWVLVGISRRAGPLKGQPVPADYGTVKRQWDAARKAAGIPDIRLHDLRAMAATEAKREGKNPTALLLHTSEAQTRRHLRGKEEPLVEGPSFNAEDSKKQ
jgi:integrase